MIRVLIADDHPVVRRGLRQIVEDETDMSVGGEAGSAEEARAQVGEGCCDVLVLDLSMPGAQGVDLLQELHEQRPELPILVLSIHPEEQYALRCLKAGARGYVHKKSAGDELVGAIRTVLGHRRYLSDALAESLLREAETDRRAPHETLSTREYQVLTRLAAGSTVSDIAAETKLSVKTVSTYRARMLVKLGIGSNAEATRYALEHQLLDS
ncbi:MAG TPA: response regulator transcription factor [Thermoanaerobaculia bacterium]|nr:response regulator transcription factor [Thermoanaerobaculia bacterium]